MSISPRSSLFRNAVFAGLVSCALTASLAAQSGQWQPGVELPTARRLLAAAGDDGKIYTFGGCGSPCFAPPLHTSTFEETRVEIYDSTTSSWSQGTPIPAVVFGAAAAAAHPADGVSKVYLFGGFVTGSSNLIYDPGGNSWQAGRAMPTPRYGLAAVAVGGKIYVLGGSNGTNAVAALEVYDPVSDTWEQLAPMPTARVFLAGAAFGGKIYAVGGSPDCCGNSVTNVVEVYDTVQRTWSQGPSLNVAMQTSAAAAFGGKIYVLGGFIPGQGGIGSTFELNPSNPSAGWIAKDSMRPPRDQAPSVALGDGIHVLGGSTNCHCKAIPDHQVFGFPHLRIEKGGGADEMCPGETISYSIKVTNDGIAPVHGALVSDDVPGSLHVTTWTCAPADSSPGAACTTDAPLSGTPMSGHADLPVGESVIYTLTGTLDVAAREPLSNSAEVRLPEHAAAADADAVSNSVDTIIRRDRLEIRKIEIPARDALAPLDSVLYEITATNHCRIPLPVTVKDALSTTGLTGPLWCRGAGCAPSTPGNLADTTTVPAGGTVIYRASGIVPCNCVAPLATVPNPATASAPGQNTVGAVDIDTVSPADDRLQVAIAGPGVLAGCSGDYAITVSNLGPCTAPNVVLTVAPPPGLNLVSLSTPCDGGSPCALGNIAAGAGSAVTVTAHFAAAAGLACPIAPRSIGATARSLCSQPPEPPAAAFSTVAIPCDLAITKSDGLASAAPGDCTLYSIDVANQGCGDAANALVTDTFPVDLGATWCRGAGCIPAIGGNIVDVLDLPRGATESYRVAATISANFVGPLANTASVALGDNAADASPADNAATDTTTVEPRPGVDAQCTGTPSFVAEGASVTFTFVLWNGGPAAQGDNPGDEFLDVLPTGLTFVSAVATSGTITILPANTVHWNGAIPVDGMVTIDVNATVDLGTLGMSFCNPATVFFDADGDGVNESSAATDDRCHPCCFTVTGAAPIPALSPLGLVVLALLAAALGVARLRPRARGRPPS